MLTELNVLTIFPRTEDIDVIVEAGMRTKQAWDNRLEFYNATVFAGPTAKVLDRVTIAGRKGDWIGLRMSAVVQADEEINKMFIEVIDQ